MWYPQEEADPDAICAVCMIEGACAGACDITTDDLVLMDHRLLTRVWMVLEMIAGITDSMDVTSEIYEAGKQPLSGLDVDISEHHLTTGTLDTLLVASQELMATLRRLAASLAETNAAHPVETSYAINHHPAGEVVREEWERTA